jgi:hypothetical protein
MGGKPRVRESGSVSWDLARNASSRTGDDPRPVRAGSSLPLGFWPECPQRSPVSSVTSCVRSPGTFRLC